MDCAASEDGLADALLHGGPGAALKRWRERLLIHQCELARLARLSVTAVRAVEAERDNDPAKISACRKALREHERARRDH